MPYIKEQDRQKFIQPLQELPIPETAGEMNYLFTMIVKSYLAKHGLNYQHLNDIIGALEGCKLELYRRTISEYENIKIIENGDV